MNWPSAAGIASLCTDAHIAAVRAPKMMNGVLSWELFTPSLRGETFSMADHAALD